MPAPALTMDRRFGEIDAWKAAGIVTIVLIHGIRPSWDPAVSGVEVWIGLWTRFGVPAFLAASGFLYATASPVSGAITLRRLRRILVPYLLASALAQIYAHALPMETGTGKPLLDLLLASSFGPYYYVFIITLLVVVTPAIARLPRAALYGVAAALVAGQWYADAAIGFPLPIFAQLRNPLIWWAYFFLGWILRLHYDRVSSWTARHRPPLVAVLSLAVVALTIATGSDAALLTSRTESWLDVYAILALLFTLTTGRGGLPRPVTYLSDATYAVYLLHLFFVYTAQAMFPPPLRAADLVAIGVPWAAGLAGPLVLVAVFRRVLGARSRDWIGA